MFTFLQDKTRLHHLPVFPTFLGWSNHSAEKMVNSRFDEPKFSFNFNMRPRFSNVHQTTAVSSEQIDLEGPHKLCPEVTSLKGCEDDDDDDDYFDYDSDDLDADEVFCDYDDVLYCDQCCQAWEGHCPTHGRLIVIRDVKVVTEASDKSRARKTAPPQVTVADAGNGVWARQWVPARTRFGPYQGRILPPDALESGYTWKIMKNGRVHRCIDGEETDTANWMRYVCRADHDGKQNMVAFQSYGKLYFRTLRAVAPHEELLVWYSDQLGRNLAAAPKTTSGRQQAYFSSETSLGEPESEKEKKRFDLKTIKPDQRNQSGNQVNDTRSDKAPLSCNQCEEKFYLSSQFMEHLKTHSGTDTAFLMCVECRRIFKEGKQLKEHLRSHRGKARPKPFACVLCKKAFCRAEMLEYHVRSHTGEKPFECSECPKRFAREYCLQQHLLTHAKKTRIEEEEEVGVCSIFSGNSDRRSIRARRAVTQPEAQPEAPFVPANNAPPNGNSTPAAQLEAPFVPDNNAPLNGNSILSAQPEAPFVPANTAPPNGNSIPAAQPEAPFVPANNPLNGNSIPSAQPEAPFVPANNAPPNGNSTPAAQPESPFVPDNNAPPNGNYTPSAQPEAPFVPANNAPLSGNSTPANKLPGMACNKCNKRFAHKLTLKSHQCNGTYFACSVCGVQYPLQRTLGIHMRMHSGEKPYHCSRCKKFFSQSSNYYSHLRRVHGRL